MARELRDTDTVEVAADQADLAKALEDERRAGAGKDKKITELAHELKAMRERMATYEGEDAAVASETQRMLELAAGLKAREEQLAQQERALREGVAKNIPVALALRGAADWDNFVLELEDFAGRLRGPRRIPVGVPVPGDPGLPKLNADHLQKMTATEISRLPDSVIERLSI